MGWGWRQPHKALACLPYRKRPAALRILVGTWALDYQIFYFPKDMGSLEVYVDPSVYFFTVVKYT